jgi:glycolate oxidase FAD binding subunit
MKQELCKAVASSDSIAVRGGGTKNALSGRPRPFKSEEARATEIDVRPLRGIATYDPSEFLITANAGTPIQDLILELANHGQYLPFDPVLAASGATLGGTIASGISGPNRMLYGGLRDFVMEIEMIDGLGRLVRGGGKVVKNAAGFDIPKLMVGSYGRLGVLIEATLKVFPQPAAHVTARFDLSSLSEVLRAMQLLQGNPLPIAAIEIERPNRLVVRFAGRPEALDIVVARAQRIVGGATNNVSATVETDAAIEADYWRHLSEFEFAPPGTQVIRVAMSGRKLLGLDEQLQSVRGLNLIRYSCGASVAWLVADAQLDMDDLNAKLKALQLPAIVVRQQIDPASAGSTSTGNTGSSVLADGSCVAGNTIAAGRDGLQLLGDTAWVSISERLQRAIDPHGKFLNYTATETADAS